MQQACSLDEIFIALLLLLLLLILWRRYSSSTYQFFKPTLAKPLSVTNNKNPNWCSFIHIQKHALSSFGIKWVEPIPTQLDLGIQVRFRRPLSPCSFPLLLLALPFLAPILLPSPWGRQGTGPEYQLYPGDGQLAIGPPPNSHPISSVKDLCFSSSALNCSSQFLEKSLGWLRKKLRYSSCWVSWGQDLTHLICRRVPVPSSGIANAGWHFIQTHWMNTLAR